MGDNLARGARVNDSLIRPSKYRVLVLGGLLVARVRRSRRDKCVRFLASALVFAITLGRPQWSAHLQGPSLNRTLRRLRGKLFPREESSSRPFELGLRLAERGGLSSSKLGSLAHRTQASSSVEGATNSGLTMSLRTQLCQALAESLGRRFSSAKMASLERNEPKTGPLKPNAVPRGAFPRPTGLVAR